MTRTKIPLSRRLADHLAALILWRKGYDTAKRRALARLRKGYALGYEKAPAHDTIHQR